MSGIRRAGKKRDLLGGLASVLAIRGETHDSFERRVSRRKEHLDPHNVAVAVERFRVEAIRDTGSPRYDRSGESCIVIPYARKGSENIRKTGKSHIGLYEDQLAVGEHFCRAFKKVVKKTTVKKSTVKKDKD